MQTLLLDLDTWDLCTDATGNLAVASDPYSVAQDVASACRVFVGDCWYNQGAGVPYFQSVLGKRPPLPLLKQWLVEQALLVAGCTNPVVYISSFADRELAGQIQFADSNNVPQVVAFKASIPASLAPTGSYLADPTGGYVSDPYGGWIASP